MWLHHWRHHNNHRSVREGRNCLVSLLNVLLPGLHEFSARILFPKPGTAKRKRYLYRPRSLQEKSHHWYLTLQQKALSWLSIQMTILKQNMKANRIRGRPCLPQCSCQNECSCWSSLTLLFLFHKELSLHPQLLTIFTQIVYGADWRALKTEPIPAQQLNSTSPLRRLSPWGLWDCLLEVSFLNVTSDNRKFK